MRYLFTRVILRNLPDARGVGPLRGPVRRLLPLFVAAWLIVGFGCSRDDLRCVEPYPVEPTAGRVWSLQYGRHGGIGCFSLDIGMADDGRTRVRGWSESQQINSRIILEGTVATERVAEISTLLAKMVKTGELRPKPWFGPFGDPCSGESDCQTMYLTVFYERKTYTENETYTHRPLGWGQLVLLLESAGRQIGYPRTYPRTEARPEAGSSSTEF